MSTSEEQELLARINSLEGRINRHKAQASQHNSTFPSRGSFRAAPYPPRGYRGRGYHAPTYRNKTLVLNGQASNTSGTSDLNAASWVTKIDRHLQLINSAVYEQESQNRTSAIEQTKRQKRQQKNQMEKARVMQYVQQNANSTSNYEIIVEGVPFQLIAQGSKLIRSDKFPASATPRSANIGGVKFLRTKNGNLVRQSIAKAQRMAGGIKKVDMPCKAFSWTGSCSKGPHCRYLHDPSKVAICRDWLLKGSCQRGEACDLSHEATEERTPLCMHYAKGKCNNDECLYVHAEHAPTDPVCRAFGFYGYCEKGGQCPDRHVFECPDFSNTGVCKSKGCKLLHRERASMLRKQDPAQKENEMEDLSSDDDGDSNDVDSDEVEEFIGADDLDDLDFSEQKDFIGF